MGAINHLKRIVDDTYTAATVLREQGDEVLRVAVAQSMGSGILCNCDFHLQKLTEHGLALSFSEGKDGRLVVRVVDV